MAIFRLGMCHAFCAGGSYYYGYELIREVGKKNILDAAYIWCLMLTAHSGQLNPIFESKAIELWNKIYTEEKIQSLRMKLMACFSPIAGRLAERCVFHVQHFSSCSLRPPIHQSAENCIRCRLDMEVKWFVESLGGEYNIEP